MRILPILTLTVSLALGLLSGCSRSKDPETYLRTANKFYDSNELEKAKLEYLNALRLQPTNVTAIVRLGDIFFRQGQFRESFPFLMEGRKRDPNNQLVAQQLATVFLAGGDPAKSRAESMAILSTSPTNEVALGLIVDAARSPKEIQEALQLLDQLQQKSGNRAALHALRAQLLERRQDTAGAEAEIQKAIALDPKSALVNLVLGGLRWSQGATNQAEQAFRTAAQVSQPGDAARFRLANYLVRTGRLEEAKTLLDEINKEAPERTPAWVLRAELALGEKNYDEANRLLERALSQAPGDFDARSLQAQLRLAQNKPAEAVKLLERMAEANPRSGAVQYQLGVANLLNKQLMAAITSLEKAAALDTNNISAVLLLSELNIARGQATKAIESLTDLARRQPQLERAQFLLGRAYVAADRPEDALNLFRSMQPRFPKTASIPFQIGLLLRQKKQDAEAQKAFEQVRKLAPDDLPSLEQLIDLQLDQRSAERALALLQPELDKNPKNARLWLLRARVYSIQQDKAGAESALEKAIELEPELQPAYLMLAELYMRTGEPKESLARLDDLLKKNPSNLTALTLKGMIQTQLGQNDDAQKSYEEALKVNPNFLLALNNLAYLLAEHRKDFDGAFTQAAKARELAPNEPSITDTLGWIEYRRKNYPEALRLLTEANEKMPDQAEIAYHLGMTFAMMGQEDAARRMLTAALKTPAKYPGREEAEQRLALLNLKPGQTGTVALATLEKQVQDNPTDLLSLLRLASAYEASGNLTKTRETLEAAYKVNPQAPEVVSRLALLEVDRNPTRANDLARAGQRLAPNDPLVSQTLGRLALQKGDAATAFGLLQSSARQQTNQSSVYADWALAAFGSGRLKEAVDLMNQAIRIGLPAGETNEAAAFTRLIIAAQNPPDAAKNLPWIEGVLKVESTNGPALYALAMGLEQQGKYSEAKDAHERLLQRFPTFVPSTRQLAILYGERLNNDTKAYEFATKARTALPKDDALARTLGNLAYRKGDYRYAVQLYGEVAKTQPKDAELQFQLGLTYLRLKQVAESRAALEKAISLNPNGSFVPEAKKLLAENKAG